MTIYVYIRVSTGKQDAGNQLAEIQKRLGASDFEVIPEVESGSVKLEKLHELIERLKEGDTLAVYALDRMGRKLRNVLEIMEKLLEKKVKVISVREGVDFSTAVGRMIAGIMGSVAEMEREMNAERTRAALQSKKGKGYLTHRPWKFDEEMRLRICALREAGFSFREIQKETGVSLGGIRYLLESTARNNPPKRKPKEEEEGEAA